MNRHTAIRAMARIGWRQVRRDAWRSALVVSLVGLPVAGLTMAIITIRTIIPTGQEAATQEMGTADIVVQEFKRSLQAEALLTELPAGSSVVVSTRSYTQNVVRGSLIYLPLEQFTTPVDRPPLRGKYIIVRGRAPRTAGEVALQSSTLNALGARIGDRIRLEDSGLTLRTSGVVVAPANVLEPVAVVGPGTLRQADADITGYWIDLPEGGSVEHATDVLRANRLVRHFETREDIAAENGGVVRAANGGAFAVASLGLICTGLIVSAAFAVGARRRVRLYGLLGAQGGEPHHIRTEIVFNGAWLGFVGSALGLALGGAAAFAVHPRLDDLTGKWVGPTELPVTPLCAAMGLGVVAAMVASFLPARAASRLSTLEQLAGRGPQSRRPGRLAVLGLVGVAVGTAAAALGAAGGSGGALTAGVGTMAIGFLVCIPLLVVWIGRMATHFPTIPRIAARDLARNGRRTGAALAAATIAMALPIAVSTSTLSSEATERRIPFMEPDQLSITLTAPGRDLESRMLSVIDDMETAFPRASVVPLIPARLASHTGESGAKIAYLKGGTVVTQEGVTTIRSAVPWIGGPALLRAFHGEEGIPGLADGQVVSIGPDSTDRGRVQLVVGAGGQERHLANLLAVEVGDTRYASLSGSGEYNYIISPSTAKSEGLVPKQLTSSVQMIFRASSPLTDGDVDRAKSIAARHVGTLVVGLRDLGSHAAPTRSALSVVGVILALGILGLTLALLSAESRRDKAILAAIGAAPSTRRMLAAFNGFLIAGVAAFLAVPIGILPIAVQITSQSTEVLIVPWATIGVIVLGVPVAAGLMTAICSRRASARQLLQPLA